MQPELSVSSSYSFNKEHSFCNIHSIGHVHYQLLDLWLIRLWKYFHNFSLWHWIQRVLFLSWVRKKSAPAPCMLWHDRQVTAPPLLGSITSAPTGCDILCWAVWHRAQSSMPSPRWLNCRSECIGIWQAKHFLSLTGVQSISFNDFSMTEILLSIVSWHSRQRAVSFFVKSAISEPWWSWQRVQGLDKSLTWTSSSR